MTSLTEQLAQRRAPEPTNEGNIDQESIPPMYPIVPPGWQGAEYSDTQKAVPSGCDIGEDAVMGKYLIATRDFDPGDCVLEDTAILQAPWDLDAYLHSPVHGLFVKLKAQHGKAALDQGYAQVIGKFLMLAKTEPRSSRSLLWDVLDWRFSTSKEDEVALQFVATAIHSCIPSSFSGILTSEETYRLICAFNTNSLACPVSKGSSSVYPLARLAEHHCRPNCTFAFLNYPADTWASRVQYRALLPIKAGDRISISYIPGYQSTSARQDQLLTSYGFLCQCSACTTEPDLARGFKCWLCPPNQGVISPKGRGDRDEDWTCMQCGVMCEHERIEDFKHAEAQLKRVKADKWKGLSQLMNDKHLHFTHYLAFRKLDVWAQKAWEEKDGETTANMVETLLKCAERVFPKNDPTLAQHHEFLGQIRHGMGEAHTSRYHYQEAYRIRKQAGHQHTYWCKKTKFMAEDKPLAELMDGK
ncbi:Protein msta [Diplonema papillatum]|nr:Protein msta [Diplonema papillatum]|eukprot:gene1375-2120_t